jgi:hypothetical protein
MIEKAKTQLRSMLKVVNIFESLDIMLLGRSIDNRTHLTSPCHRIKFTNRYGINYLALRCSLIFLNKRARIIAVATESERSAISYWLAVLTVIASRIAVRGAPNASVMAAVSMHNTKIDSDILGKARLMARAIIVEEKRIGKIGPPR